MSVITARVSWITYYNEENFYSILACADNEEKFTVLGNIVNPVRGQEYTFDGEWVFHPKYGRQFKAENAKMITPTSVERIKELLVNGSVKGIGKKTAERIVAAFGDQSLNIIENDPERLREVKGIGSKTVEKIILGWRESQEVLELQTFLQNCGVPVSLASRIYKEYGSESVETIKKNPYILTEDLWGVGFKTADKIAYELGFSVDDPNRLRAGILAYLKHISLDGHCFEYEGVLVNTCAQGLRVSPETIWKRLEKMINAKDGVIAEDDAIYLKSYFYAEYGIAKKLYEMNSFEGSYALADIDYLEEKYGIKYDEIQIDAIKNSLKNKVAVITGGPGTGKTTIIKAIVSSFKDFNMDVVLASPTGRAAKRMSEVVGMEAQTIHRLLKYDPRTNMFTKNEDNPIEGDVLILDECSMIDELLMYSLLKALPISMNIVMVGDIDQLPSVGPGNVLADIINSECFYVARLEKVFRQAEESDIIVNAHRINSGKDIILRNRDVKFVKTGNIKQTILDIVKNIEKAGFTASDVQVLSPLKKTDVGTQSLNNALQETLNQNPVVKEFKYTKYRIGDRIMQIRNNYDKDIFNGSLGVVEDYDEESKRIIVRFDDNVIGYESGEMDEIMLAYAITVHKSQGSEFPVVIIPLTMAHSVMLQRNLIYTAFTRPSKLLYLVGYEDALKYAIGNNVSTKRQTRLIEKIRKWNNA